MGTGVGDLDDNQLAQPMGEAGQFVEDPCLVRAYVEAAFSDSLDRAGKYITEFRYSEDNSTMSPKFRLDHPDGNSGFIGQIGDRHDNYTGLAVLVRSAHEVNDGEVGIEMHASELHEQGKPVVYWELKK
tara:strand:+ start:1359 stop:1745 length:387 start_codon:yes stop_codon:yes gene_type:complete